MNQIPLQIAYITGRSRPGYAQLSPVQSAFINQLARPERRLIRLNFPYFCHADNTPGIRPARLLTASFNNSRDYYTSRYHSFQQRYQSSVAELLAQAKNTVLLAGSCGLELFNNLHLPGELMPSTTLIAYGAVARKRPACRHILIQGDRDWLSKIYFRSVDYKVSCGHMNYLSSPEVFAICERYIAHIDLSEGI